MGLRFDFIPMPETMVSLLSLSSDITPSCFVHDIHLPPPCFVVAMKLILFLIRHCW